ncbi:MAG: sugar kinase [Lachnospiraceae bacterium]
MKGSYMRHDSEKRAFDLLTMGEIMLRLSPPRHTRLSDSEIFEKHAGGAELNVAAGVSQLGLRSAILTKLPDTALGSYLKNRIRFMGVSDDYLIYDHSPEARLGLYYYEGGAYPRKPSVIYDRQNSSINRLSVEELPEDIWTAARMFHTTGITLALSPALRRITLDAVRRFHAHGTFISFDVNYRANLWSEEEARETIREILPLVDVLFISEETSRRMFQKTGELKDIMKSFAEEFDIRIIASTQRTVYSPRVHDFSSVVYDAAEAQFHTESPYRNIDVIDRIGSGDAFVAGALFGLLKYKSAERAMQFGNAISSFKDTVPGDLISTSFDEISSIIRQHQGNGSNSEMNR